jgi:choline/glycine/proline betaine transport protein
LKEDYMLLSTVQNHTSSIQVSDSSKSWKEHLGALITKPNYGAAKAFLKDIVQPSLQELSDEFINKDLDAHLDFSKEDSIRVVIKNKGVEDFYYGIRLLPFVVPTYHPENQEKYFRAEVFILQGGQGYDIYGYSKDQVIADAINQYEKHFQFLHIQNSEQPDFKS